MSRSLTLGNPATIERESALGAFYYQYDALSRLTWESQRTRGAPTYETYYVYDPAGNRTMKTQIEYDKHDPRWGPGYELGRQYYQYNAANELLNVHDVGSGYFVYDAEATTVPYQWDKWNYFAYDANGNTTREQTPLWTRYFAWDRERWFLVCRSPYEAVEILETEGH